MITLLAQTTLDIKSQATDIAPIVSFKLMVEKFANVALIIGALLTFGYMLWGAIQWIMSEGQSEKMASARQKIMHAMIGLSVLASTFAIMLVLQYFLGFYIFKGGSRSLQGQGDGESNIQIDFGDRKPGGVLPGQEPARGRIQ